MKRFILPKMLVLTALMGLTISPLVSAKQMYHWTDEHGKQIFSDQVPPSQAQQIRETLDKNGRVISVTEKPKTQEQIETEKRLNELKQRQEKVIADQRNKDKKLLSNYLKIEDMQASYKNKMEALDFQIKDRQAGIKKVEDDLAKQRTEVSNNERNNKKTPPDILKAIDDDEKKIAQLKGEIQEIEVKKEKAKKEFETDSERYLFLTHSKGQSTNNDTLANPDKALNKLGLFTCDTSEQCDKAWKIAREFVKNNAHGNKLNVDSDKLVMTNDPKSVNDLGLSVSKTLGENNKWQLFLDIRCIENQQQKEQCADSSVDALRNQLRAQFSNHIRAELGLAAKTPDVPAAALPTPPVAPVKK